MEDNGDDEHDIDDDVQFKLKLDNNVYETDEAEE